MSTATRPRSAEAPPLPHSRPDVGRAELEALADVLASGQLKGGPRVAELEERLAADLGAAGAVATSSGSQAIHLALRVLFDGRPAVIGLPSYVCRTVHDAIRLANCTPRILDIDPRTLSVSIAAARAVPDLAALVVPHMFGIRAPIEGFLSLGIPIIEDCAQRLPPLHALEREQPAPFRVLSLEGTKLFTAGEGGLLLCADESTCTLARRIRDGTADWQGAALCASLTDLQAAVALVQWERLPSFLRRRRQLYEFYLRGLTPDFADAIHPATTAPDTHHHRFLLRVRDPDAFIRVGAQHNILFRRPVGPLPLHRIFGDPGEFPATDDAYEHVVSIPFYPKLTVADAERVLTATHAALKVAL